MYLKHIICIVINGTFQILKTLECLPITNKTQLTDSRVLSVVERWTKQNVDVGTNNSPPPPPPPKADLTCVPQSLEADPNKKTRYVLKSKKS